MSELRLEGRLGVETVSPLRGCCVDTMLKWRPQTLGDKRRCMYCENPLKTIRASDAAPVECTGMMNETSVERASPYFVTSAIWFGKNRFPSESKVSEWCNARGLESSVVKADNDAYSIEFTNVQAGTERAMWAAPGVIAVMGIAKMDTGDMASGGSINPLQQGAAADKEPETTDEKPPVVEDGEDAVTKSMRSFEAALEKML